MLRKIFYFILKFTKGTGLLIFGSILFGKGFAYLYELITGGKENWLEPQYYFGIGLVNDDFAFVVGVLFFAMGIRFIYKGMCVIWKTTENKY